MRIPTDPPRFTDLISTLQRHTLAPAIVFLTSRRACDEAVESFRGAHTADIGRERQQQIEAIIDRFDDEAPFIRQHRHYPMLVRKGVGAHHAGHLPAWKHVVEKTMAAGLLNAVFATSTLAAGIDMPARSVVITASSLRSDEGHRDIKSFELSQMTGRAGRRGKDKVGFAVFIPGPFQDMDVIREKLLLPPEPIESSFQANYTMVLNLLQVQTPEAARELVERSFRHFQNLKSADRSRARLERVKKLVADDAQSCPAGNRALTFPKYTELSRSAVRIQKSLRSLQKRKAKDSLVPDPEWETVMAEGIATTQTELTAVQTKLATLPCETCSQVKQCGAAATENSKLQGELRSLEGRMHELENGLWSRFEDCVAILQHFDYLTESWQPTLQGTWAARLRVENTLFIAELLREGLFDVPTGRTLAAICGALAAEEREFPTVPGKNEDFVKPLKQAMKIARHIAAIQEQHYVFCPMFIDPDAGRLLWAWADGKLEWPGLLDRTDASEGDIVRLILRTADLLSQLTGLSDTHPEVAARAREAMRLIRRAPVED
ncbi:MAG: hypothetical protein K1Y36_03115 [Blastocatellia bacterium]|nr:hypothetical protein [Blastocatellia bacterium]